MNKKKLSILIGFLFFGITAVAGQHHLLVGNFSFPPAGEYLPAGWEPLFFENIEKTTSYRRQKVDGNWVVSAESNGGASGLITRQEIDPGTYPIVSWSWKIAGVIKSGDVFSRSGDDYPARLYITFGYDPDKVGFLESIKFNAIKLFYGEYPPVAAINYIWANKAEVGLVTSNSYTDRVKMIVIQSGEEKAGRWVQERRNIAEDYRKAFGEDLPLISGVAIMTDTDNTGESARAWYGDIVFSRR